ncbi:MAG: hypothetical protein IT382_21975 [Deltaproteobacteria bacterium]|nr:hypothetical protein [Deltaproteobacteria bacterium]
MSTLASFGPRRAGSEAGPRARPDEDNAVDRAFLLRPEGPLGPYPPTDGGDWCEAGVPLVNFISNPVYLVNSEDDLSWMMESRLARIATVIEPPPCAGSSQVARWFLGNA